MIFFTVALILKSNLEILQNNFFQVACNCVCDMFCVSINQSMHQIFIKQFLCFLKPISYEQKVLHKQKQSLFVIINDEEQYNSP